MNWRIKILAKLILSRFNFSYATWHKLGIFVHGNMDNTDYALQVAEKHLFSLKAKRPLEGAVCLELGPGDSLASAVVAHAYGAGKFYLVDTGKFANTNLAVYAEITKKLREKEADAADFSTTTSIEEMLDLINSKYLTKGIKSLELIESNSIDFIWSQAVLEHIRIADLDALFTEMFRILKPGSYMSHSIDFKDHLGGGLNNLRFSKRVWESDLMANSGFYTNRVRYSEMLQKLENAGFNIISAEAEKWENTKISRKELAKEFKNLSQDDILTYRGNIIVSKN